MIIHTLIFLVYLYIYTFHVYEKAHLQAKVFIASITFVLPMINGYIIYTTGNQYLDLYYVILWSQCLSYLFDIIPSYKNKNYNQVVHHLIGLPLNYCGFITRYDYSVFVLTNNIYFLEQGWNVFYYIFKLLDLYGFKHHKIRLMFKNIHFKGVLIVFTLKILNTVFVYITDMHILIQLMATLQLVWNVYTLKNKKLL